VVRPFRSIGQKQSGIVFGSLSCFRFLLVQRFTCTDSHFKITRAAERSACDGNGKAKQGKQGEEKE
jgi:hypothetical protein